MPMMTFDLQDGKPPVSFSINNEGAERFMDFMAECTAMRDATPPLCPECQAREAGDGELTDLPDCFGMMPVYADDEEGNQTHEVEGYTADQMRGYALDNMHAAFKLAATQPPLRVALPDHAEIRAILMGCGFTIKEGQTDLKPYVYEAVAAVLKRAGIALPDHERAAGKDGA